MLDKMMKALGIAGAPRRPAVPVTPIPNSGAVDRPKPMAGYVDRGSAHARSAYQHFGPAVPLRTADLDVRYGWSRVAASIRHMAQNSGWLAGAIDQATAYTVGTGLRPQIVPDHAALGWTAETAKLWARTVEMIFEDWAESAIECDDRQQFNFGALQAQSLRTWFTTGDIIVHYSYRARRNASFATAIAMIDPARVAVPPPGYSRPQQQVTQGIELDEFGTPAAFWLKPLPGELGQGTRIPVWGPNERLSVVHTFIGEVGQVRGVSPFAPVVEAIHQCNSVNDSMTLAAAAAAAIIGTVTSDLPSNDLARALGGDGSDALSAHMAARASFHEKLAEAGADITLGPAARVHHLTSGEKFELHAGKTHYEHFPEHMKILLREISRASGLPYETFTLDRSAASYSSGRLGIADFWAIVEKRRATLIEPFCKVALENLVEEMIDRGRLSYPGGLDSYRRQKSLATRAYWIGPPKPQADELKAVRASVEALKWGLTSLSSEVAHGGGDWEETMRQTAAEQQLADHLGLTLPRAVRTERVTKQEPSR